MPRRQAPASSLLPASRPSLPAPAARALVARAGVALALAWFVDGAARAHGGVRLAVARDNTRRPSSRPTCTRCWPATGVRCWRSGLENLPYDRFSPHPDIISQRLATMRRLPTLARGIVVVPVQTLMQRLPPLSYVVGNSFDLRVGQRLDLDAEKRRLQSAGYRNVPQVYDPGDFAVRGALLDVYPMGEAAPFRVELLDEEIDTIRVFDPESQRSLDKVARCS